MILKSDLKQNHREKISKIILLSLIVLGLTFNAEIVMKSYSQPTPTPTPSPGSQGVVPQQQPQQQPQSGQAELTRLLAIEDNIQKLLAQLDTRRGQIESVLSPPPELTPKPAPLSQQQQQEYFRLLQDITNRQQQLLDQLQKLDLQIQQVQQPVLAQPAQQVPGQQVPGQQVPGQQVPAQQQEVPVTVKFISIKVNNDRDPNTLGIQNDGEYLLDAFVNGEKVSLGTKGGLLWDVRGGAPPYKFPETAQVTVNVPRDGFLTINTVGSEVDGCGNTRTLPTKLPDPVTSAIQKAGIPGLSTVSKYLDTLNPAVGLSIPPGASQVLSALGLKQLFDPTSLLSLAACKLDPNDTIGEVNQVYPGPDFGRGLKTIESDTGYWILSYEIQPSV